MPQIRYRQPLFRFQRFINVVLVISLLATIYPVQLWAQAPLPETTSSARALEGAANEPVEAVRPLAVSMQQSGYQADGSLVVTYTVRNLAGPTIRPNFTPGESITDTFNALLATDFTADPNTIRDVLLTDALTSTQSTLLDATPATDSDSDRFVFNLGDIPPLGEATAIITITAPSSDAGFTTLSAGGAAHGTWRGRLVSAETQPIGLVPDDFTQWLVCTIDANCNDSYVQRKSAELNHDPTAIFNFVRDLSYETYDGSLRGARGTLWSEGGNGVDQASLLVALLRASGIPTAYHQGNLATTDAQTLISSMFDNANTLGGYIPAGTPVADPTNDSTLLQLAANHAWVEAYLPGTGWTLFDPSFPTALPGLTFATSNSGRIAELPDTVRHKVTLSVTVEKYSEFPIGGTGLDQFSPLAATINSVELIGEPVVFSHFVESNSPGGLIFANTQHTYTPYFLIGSEERLINGTAFDDLITSFPLATNFVVAEWLDISTIAPDGTTETYRRELFDDIGVAARTGAGFAGNLGRDETPRLSLISSWNTLFAPSKISLDALNQTYQEMIELSVKGAQIKAESVNHQDSDNPSPETIEFAKSAATEIGRITRLAQRMHLLDFTTSSDAAHDYIADATYVKAYADSPRIFTVGWERNPQTDLDTLGFDMIRNQLRSVPYPGQTDVGHDGYRMMAPLIDIALETQVLEKIAPKPVVSVSAIFDKASETDVEITRITLGNLEHLAALPLSAEAKARILQSLQDNPDSYILVPSTMILLDGATDPTVGWLQIDNDTQAVTDMLEDGTHGASIEYAVLGKFSKKVGSLIGGFSGTFLATTMGFWVGFFESVPITDVGAAISNGKQKAGEMGEEAKKACSHIGDGKWCSKGASAGLAAGMAAVSKADPPVNAQLWASPFDLPEVTSSSSQNIVHNADLSGNVVATLKSQHISSFGGDETWSSVADNSFEFETLTVNATDVTSGGSSLGMGNVTAISGTLHSNGQTLSVNTTPDGSLSIYAPVDGINAAAQRGSYVSDLTPGAAVTLLIEDAELTLNGTSHSGDFTITTASMVSVTGDGATAAPNFATSASFTAAGDGISVGPAVGTLSVGGAAISAENGFAMGNATGTISVTPDGNENDIAFNGPADFFALSLDATTSSVPANAPTSFSSNFTSNYADTFATTVFAPEGWDLTLSATGAITAQPPVGAAVGDYTIIVTAQSLTYPALFVSAEHTVTVTAVDGVTLTVSADPQFTIPFGPNHETTNLDINGQFQMPDGAFLVELHNTSNIGRTYDVNVTGLPSGWPIFGAQHGNTQNTVSLAAGQKVELSLYILPTVSDLLPLVGNNYPFTVVATAQDNGAVTATDGSSFTVPATPYPAIAIEPSELYVLPNSTNTFTATLTNIGTGNGTFSWETILPKANWSAPAPAPVALAPGASSTAAIMFDVITGTAALDHPISIAVAAPTLPYTPTNAIDIYVTSASATPIVVAGQDVGVCSADSVLSAHFIATGNTLTTLEGSCAAGSCDSGQRDDVVSSVTALTSYLASNFPTVDSSAAVAAAATLSGASTVQENLDALPAIATTVSALAAPICLVAESQPRLTWTPPFDSVLTNDTITYTLELLNGGTLASTYALTVALPTGQFTDAPTINPGAIETYEFPLTVSSEGLIEVPASVSAAVSPLSSAAASAYLNVVNQFVQTLSVNPTPSFIENSGGSSLINIDVANYANLPLPATAYVEVLGVGGVMLDSAETDLIIRPGEPLGYDLNTVDTSTFPDGVYTVTVDLRNQTTGLSLVDGSGYNFLAVGQALGAAHFVAPEIVGPGTATVTTVISTSILVETAAPTGSGRSTAAPLWEPTGLRAYDVQPDPTAQTERTTSDQTSLAGSGDGLIRIVESEPVEFSNQESEQNVQLIDDASSDEQLNGSSTSEENETADEPVASGQQRSGRAPTGYTRVENIDAAITYTGAWSNRGYNPASASNVHRSTAAGDVASYSFTGTWVNLGLVGNSASAAVEIFIDGASQGVVDLYRNETKIIDNVFSGLTNASHTISVTTLAPISPFATNTQVNLDFIDTWDGTVLPGGAFEQDDAAFIYSSLWSSRTDSDASGGSYHRATSGSAWFPFYGTSVSLEAFAYNGGGSADFYIDGVLQERVELYNATDISRTFSFDGLSNDLHLLTIIPQQNFATVDAMHVPAITPAYSAPTPVGYTRFEEDSTAIVYDGAGFDMAQSNWQYMVNSRGSGNFVARTNVADNTISYTFTGDWAALGFVGSDDSGEIELWLDGVSQGVVDLYRQIPQPVELYFDLPVSTTHTISATVLGTANPFASNSYAYFDYADTWDGSSLPDGTFEDSDSGRILYSANGWNNRNDGDASGGTYKEATSGAIWFPFTGTSVSFQALARFNMGWADIYLDGDFQHRVEIYSPFDITRTYSLDGLSNDLHVLTIVPHQVQINLDSITTPATTPAYSDPVETGIIRVEEYDPVIRYNGVGITATNRTWGYVSYFESSERYVASSQEPGDSISFSANGTWLNLGFIGSRSGGEAEIFIDGVSQGVVDLYRRETDVVTLNYALSSGSHDVTINVLGTGNAYSSDERVEFDYFEIWDGSSEPGGTFEADFNDLDRIRLSNDWSLRTRAGSNDGSFIESDQGNLWFHFTDTSITLRSFEWTGADLARIYIDDVLQTTLDLNQQVEMSSTLTIDGLSAGPHVLRVEGYRGEATVDTIFVPAIEPASVLSSCGSYCRYEEDDAAIRYNGVPYANTSQDIFINTQVIASNGYQVRLYEPGETMSLDFSGTQAAIGFIGQAQSGHAAVYIDGNLVETVDTYSKDNRTLLYTTPVLAAGAHTISVTHAGAQHPNATGNDIYVDFIDVWDGTPLPSGTEEVEDVALVSSNWFVEDNVAASNGSYLRNANNTVDRSIWVPFEGDGVQLDLFKWSGADRNAQVYVDGNLLGDVNFWAPQPMTETVVYDGFGPGAHLLQIVSRFNEIGVDTVTFPPTVSAETPPPTSPIIRYEEDELTYNGYPWLQRPQSWGTPGIAGDAPSAQRVARSTSAGDSASLTFTGSAVNIGWYNGFGLGSAEIYIDGISQGIIDLSTVTRTHTVTRITDLITATHTLSVEVASGGIAIDYIDVWDGSPVPDGTTDPWPGDVGKEARVHFGEFLGFNGTEAPNAFGGRYVTGWFNANHSVYHTFVGDSITYYAFSTTSTNSRANIYIDGVFMETVNSNYPFSQIPLAFHYNDLGPGLHEIRVDNNNAMRVDAFTTPATNMNLGPQVEWFDDTPAGNNAPFFGTFGMVSGITTGDINNDGIIELVFGANTYSPAGDLYVYRADGGDSGDGDPIIWSEEYGGSLAKSFGTPALGNIDGDVESEIIITTGSDIRAYEHDGVLKWAITNTLTTADVTGAPALGNLDADAEPEIVINLVNSFAVLEPEGTVAWQSPTTPYWHTAPMLADLNGDTILDIISADWGSERDAISTTVSAWNYNYGSPILLWTRELTPGIAAIQSATFENGLLGSHAVADIDSDDQPEILISHYGWISALNHDGSILWQTELEPGFPGGVSVADIDGDGEVEIITGMKHEFDEGDPLVEGDSRFGKLYALEADGTLKWDVIAEDSTSANNAAVLDLNGDGIYEIAWNGKEQGFTIYNGADGSILFNEPLAFTISGSDYPIIVDVDNDDHAEIVVPTLRGPVVFGMDDVWTEARTIWNQQTYHINNVNDDLSIPFSEFNSWDSHNTYHTQYPGKFVLPIFGVNISHTVGSTNLLVDGFSNTPDVSADPSFEWNYVQTVSNPTITRTLDLVLSNLVPGETRLVAEGTTISYTLGSGQNEVQLPPLYVTVADIIAMTPATLTVGTGATASYSITLTNPGLVDSNYVPTITGIPASWVSGLPASIPVPAGDEVVLALEIATPEGSNGAYPFNVAVSTDGGVNRIAGAIINVVDSIDITISPISQNAAPGETTTYVVTVGNHLDTAQEIDLLAGGLPNLMLASSVNAPANGVVTTTLLAKGYSAGPLPFTVSGSNEFGHSDSGSAVLDVIGAQDVLVVLNPDPVDGGPGMPSVVTVTVTNIGQAVATYGLSVSVPAGWEYELALDEVTIAPFVLNSAEIQLLLTPPIGTAPSTAFYDVTATAIDDASRSASEPASATTTGVVNIGNRAVQIDISPETRVLLPSSSATWDVTITNTGSVQDTFDLSVTGIVALSGTFSQGSVTLNPGQSTVVQLSAIDFSYALPLTYTFAAVATSSIDSSVVNQADASIQFATVNDVEVSYSPDMQTVGVNEIAEYVLTITNTGNIASPFDVILNSTGVPNLTVVGSEQQALLPAHSSVQVVVQASASEHGEFVFDGSAESTSRSSASDTATLIVQQPSALTALNTAIQPASAFQLISILLITAMLGLLTLVKRPKHRR